MSLRSIATTTFGVFLLASLASAQDEHKINFQDDIAPIFEGECNACHNGAQKKGGLALDTYAALMEGGGSGAVIVPGEPAKSRLYLLVAHEETPTMPPNSPKMIDEDLSLIQAWIAEGARESSGSVVALAAKPKLDFTLDPDSIGKPIGEPAMPSGLSTEPVVLSERPNAILALAASPWAPLVAVAGHKQVLLYEIQTQRLVGVLPFEEGVIHALSFSRDGGILLAGGGVGGRSGVAVGWDVETGERLFEVGKEYDVVLAADISPDRRLVAVGGPSKLVRVYAVADGSLVYEAKKHTEWVTSIAFSPDGVLLASGDRNGGLVVWESWTGREFYDLRGHSALISGLTWRLDSNVLGSASEDGTIRLWNMIDGGQIKNWNAHGGGALDVNFAKDGRLVSTGRDRVTKLWDQEGSALQQFEAFGDLGLQAVATFDDAAIVAGDWAGDVRIWAGADGRRLGNLIANPAPIKVRLEQVKQEYTAARIAADAALTEFEPLNAAVAEAAQALEAAAQAKASAEQAVEAANGEVRTSEEALASAEATWKSREDARTAASRDLGKASEARVTAEAVLSDRLTAARSAAASLAESPSDVDRKSAAARAAETTAAARAVEEALAHQLEATDRLASASESVAAAAATRDQAAANLDLARQRATAAADVLASQSQEWESTRERHEQATVAMAEKSTLVHGLVERAEGLKAQLDALNAEQAAQESHRGDVAASHLGSRRANP